MLWLRVGVTGHRHIDPGHPGLKKAVDFVIAYADSARQLASTKSTDVGLAVVSSLAEGADRVITRAVLSSGDAKLEAILPLDQDDYRTDFGSPASELEFQALLDAAATVDTTGPGRSREEAYELAGRAVVDRSDIMVVVWDGEHARGRGGTAEIYKYALKRKKTVIWIRVGEGHAEVITANEVPATACPLPPEASRRLDQYNRKRLPDALFHAAPKFLTHMRSEARLEAGTLLIEHVLRYFIRADAIALRFQRRWLWVTRLLYALAALAVVVVAAQILFEPSHPRYAWIEFGILVCVTALLVIARSAHWHQRWVSARYLAEQIRSLVFLGLVGIADPEEAASAQGRFLDPVDESSWTTRAVAEIWWSRPRHDPSPDVGVIKEVLEREWIADQREYHETTSKIYGKRSRRLTKLAVSLFIMSAGAALLHSLGTGADLLRPYKFWDFCSIVIPAMGAALSGYGAQRDYARHAERSRGVVASLTEAAEQLQASESLRGIQQVALSVSRVMRGEATGWYSVVHSQDVEVP